MAPLLLHIHVSHYSEKVRWALDFKDVPHRRLAPPPPGHVLVSKAVTRGKSSTFPVMRIDGQAYGDSTDIVAALEERFPTPPLYPADPDERARALALEEFFDEEAGPYTRRNAFHEVLRDPVASRQIVPQLVPPPMSWAPGFVAATARRFSAWRYDAADDAAAATAREKVRAAFDRLEAELDGNDYLVGDRFSIADLTAAALLYPVVLPAEGPDLVGDIPAPYAEFQDSLRDRRAWAWVEEMFRRHR